MLFPTAFMQKCPTCTLNFTKSLRLQWQTRWWHSLWSRGFIQSGWMSSTATKPWRTHKVWVLATLQTHLLVITKQPLFSAVITQPPQFTFWPSAVQPSGQVTRRKRQIFPNWKTSKGPLRGWWGCRMYMLSKLRASWGAVSRESLMASPLISTCPQCLSHCLVTTAFWLERYTSHYFPLLLLNWIRSTKKFQYNNLKILHFK